jgi:hypothetical protein
MKEYKNNPAPTLVCEPAVAYAMPSPCHPFDMDNAIPLDESGIPVGHTLDEVFDRVDRNLSEAYGVDFAKVTRLVRSKLLSEDDITNELLLSPEFKYEPYPGFKPRPRKRVEFTPEYLAAMKDVFADE